MIFFHRIKSQAALYMIGLLIAIVWSCGDILDSSDYEIEGLEVTPTVALPLAYGDLSIQDILSHQDSANIKVYPDGLVYLEYNQTLKTQAIRDLISIEDQNNVMQTLAVPPGTILPVVADYTSTQQTKVIVMNIAPEELTEVLLKAGQIAYTTTMVPNNANFRYGVKITIPEFTINGTPFSQEVSGSGSLSLANHLYTSAVPNQLTIEYALIIKQNPNTVVIPPATVINVNLSFQGLDFKYAKGFFADQTADLPGETIVVDAFGSSLTEDSDISFVAPKIEFTVTNEVGVATKVYFSALEARKSGSPSMPILINPASPVDINFPTTMGFAASTTVNVTNVQQLIDYAPTEFYYKAGGRINEGVVTANNFVTDTSKLSVTMHVEIPIHGHASRIKLSDTLDIDLSDFDESDIESASLKVKILNELPLNANVQFYLTDDNHIILDSLLAPNQTNLVKSSQVTGTGDLQTAGLVDDLIPISNAKIQKIFDATKIIIVARMHTTKDNNGNYPDVKFKSHYRMNVRLGLQAKLKLKADL